MERPEIQRLFEEAQAGSRQALETLLKRHTPLVASIAGRCTDNVEDREDFIQEVMRAACASFANAREGKAFTKWMMSIAENQGKNWLSRERPKQRATSSLDSEIYQDGGSAQQIERQPCPEDKIVLEETKRYLSDVLEKCCSGVEYNVMVRKWREYDYARIARELSINEGTARSHYHRGERKFWMCLLTDHRDFLGGEAVIAGAIAKAAQSTDLESRLTEDEKQAFQAGNKSNKAFASACMKVRLFLPLSACLLLIWSVLHG
jgi:RNA polymerase sigma factor (sigma-70 family)